MQAKSKIFFSHWVLSWSLTARWLSFRNLGIFVLILNIFVIIRRFLFAVIYFYRGVLTFHIDLDFGIFPFWGRLWVAVGLKKYVELGFWIFNDFLNFELLKPLQNLKFLKTVIKFQNFKIRLTIQILENRYKISKF